MCSHDLTPFTSTLLGSSETPPEGDEGGWYLSVYSCSVPLFLESLKILILDKVRPAILDP